MLQLTLAAMNGLEIQAVAKLRARSLQIVGLHFFMIFIFNIRTICSLLLVIVIFGRKNLHVSQQMKTTYKIQFTEIERLPLGI